MSLDGSEDLKTGFDITKNINGFDLKFNANKLESFYIKLLHLMFLLSRKFNHCIEMYSCWYLFVSAYSPNIFKEYYYHSDTNTLSYLLTIRGALY